MASPNSPDNDPPGDDSQNGSTNDATALINPLLVQNPRGSLERCLTISYAIQTSVMSNLNRLDFKNLLLAGLRTPISLETRRKFLIPSKCDVTLEHSDIISTCSNTTRTLDEIKACHGTHRDGYLDLQSRRERWIGLIRLLKHVRGSSTLGESTGETEAGHFDSFNVCIDCHNRDRQRLDRYENHHIGLFRTLLCQFHALQHVEERPYNVCRCKMLLESYWRCHACSLATLGELRLRARTYKIASSTTSSTILTTRNGVWIGEDRQCPIPGCTNPSWVLGPHEKQMWMCKACTAIFPGNGLR